MPRNKKTSGSKKRSHKAGAKGAEAKIQELIDLQKQQLQYAEPNIRDIMFPTLSRGTKYSFIVSVSGSTISVVSTGAPTAGGLSFSLNTLSQSSSFTGLFDRYRILNIQVQFNPTLTGNLTVPITTAIDYDDAATPTTEIAQRETALTVPTSRYFERSFTPRIAVAAYSGTFTGYANMSSKQWLDASSTGIQYYGLKYYIPGQAVTSSQVYTITVRYFLQCKNNF